MTAHHIRYGQNSGLKKRQRGKRSAYRPPVKAKGRRTAASGSSAWIAQAQTLLQRAKEQYDEAAVHSWDPQEPADCVTKCFYSYENAVSAVGAFLGRELPENHYDKVDLARQFAEEGKLSTDVHDRLLELNELRKNVSYGEPGPELAKVDLGDLVTDLEAFLEEVEELIDRGPE